MEVTDSNIRNLLPPNVKFSPNQYMINKLSKFYLLGRNAYYWDNILLSLANDPYINENKSTNSILSIIDNKFNITSLLDTLIQWDTYFTENILQECKNLRPTHISMPLEHKNYQPLNHNVVMNRIANYQKRMPNINENPVDTHKAIQLHKGKISVIQNETKVELAKLFKIKPSQIWYPLDNEGVSTLRCVFHLLLRLYGLDIPFLNINSKNTSIPDDYFKDCSFVQFCEYFITQIPKKGKISEEMFNHFNVGFYQDNSQLCHFILQLVQDIYEASYSTHIMKNLNVTIISRIKQKLEFDINLPNTNSKENHKSNNNYCKKITKNILQETIICNSSLSANDVLQILSSYPNLKDDTNIISLGLCPIKSKYIISTFPYYKGREIIVKDGIINKVPIKDEEISINNNAVSVPKIFSYLKKIINFDGNYVRYKSIIKSVNIELEDLVKIYSIFYNLNGFSCTVIAAEILDHYNNIQTNSQNMFVLLSKLTSVEIKNLDATLENTCTLEEEKLNPMDLLLRSNDIDNVRSISTNRVDHAMKKLIKIQNFFSMINTISINNYNFMSVEIVQYYNNIKNKMLSTKETECIKLLLLYSDVSDRLKTWIYDSLSKKYVCKNKMYIDNKYDIMNRYRKMSNNDYLIKTIHKYPFNNLSVYEIYKNGIEQGFNLKNCVSDLLQYVEQTKDCQVLELIEVIMINQST